MATSKTLNVFEVAIIQSRPLKKTAMQGYRDIQAVRTPLVEVRSVCFSLFRTRGLTKCEIESTLWY